VARYVLPLFFGHESRVEAGTSAFVKSVLDHSSVPVGLCPITRRITDSFDGVIPEGSNSFTLSRFLVPWITGYQGMAIFVDGSDMLVRGDLKELASLFNPFMAVQVVKLQYKTRHPVKFIGTTLETQNQDYDRKQWASVMIINCAHFSWRSITPTSLADFKPLELLQFQFIRDRYIGDIPESWNWLVDEFGENPDARLLHWTAGVPGLDHYKDAPMAGEWKAALASSSRITGTSK